MRSALAFSLMSMLVFACGGKGEETAPPKERAERPAAADGGGEGRSLGGWRWKGDREDCFFVVESRCFDSKKGACEAAGCPDATCVHDGSAPAKVSCKED